MSPLKKNLLLLAAVGLLSACGKKINFDAYESSDALFRASVAAMESGENSVAAAGFERLTLTLGSRDPLLAGSHFYHGVVLSRQKEPLLAADAFNRVQGLFPADTLADDALLNAALEYRRAWRDPELDPTWGEAAKAALERLLTGYPQTTLRDQVFRELESLNEAFATKIYEAARGYYRTRAYHAAITYSRDLIEQYPATRRARDARLMIVRSYQKLKWDEERLAECVVLGQLYQDDAEVNELCGVRIVTSAAAR